MAKGAIRVKKKALAKKNQAYLRERKVRRKELWDRLVADPLREDPILLVQKLRKLYSPIQWSKSVKDHGFGLSDLEACFI